MFHFIPGAEADSATTISCTTIVLVGAEAEAVAPLWASTARLFGAAAELKPDSPLLSLTPFSFPQEPFLKGD